MMVYILVCISSLMHTHTHTHMDVYSEMRPQWTYTGRVQHLNEQKFKSMVYRHMDNGPQCKTLWLYLVQEKGKKDNEKKMENNGVLQLQTGNCWIHDQNSKPLRQSGLSWACP